MSVNTYNSAMHNAPAVVPFKSMCDGVKKKAEVSDDRVLLTFCAACVNPRDAEVRAAAVEDIRRGHVIYN